STDYPQSNWTRTRYGGTGSQAPVEAISLQGTGHNLMANGMAAMVIEFFGLDEDVEPTDPPTDPTDPPTDPTDPPTDPPQGDDCSATIDVVNDWGSGWQGNVLITAGDSAVSGWTLTWPWPSGQSKGNVLITAGDSAVSGWTLPWPWPSGQSTGNVLITAGDSAVSGGTLPWTRPSGQSISSSWNADVSSSGSSVTARDVGWNADIAAG